MEAILGPDRCRYGGVQRARALSKGKGASLGMRGHRLDVPRPVDFFQEKKGIGIFKMQM